MAPVLTGNKAFNNALIGYTVGAINAVLLTTLELELEVEVAVEGV